MPVWIWRRARYIEEHLPAENERTERRCNAHETCAKGHDEGAGEDRALAAPAVHDEVGDGAAEEATCSVDGGDDGECRVGHRDTGGEAIVVVGKAKVTAGEDSLELIEAGDVEAVLTGDKVSDLAREK